MKNIRISRVVFLVIALISVGLMAWAIVAGASAPESSDIAKNMASVGKINATGDGIQLDEKQMPIPVESASEGIEATQVVFTYQYRADDIYGGYLADLSNKRMDLMSYEKTIAAFEQDPDWNYEQAVARIAELKKATSSKDKKELAELEERVEQYKSSVANADKVKALISPDENADEVTQVLYYANGSMKQCEARIAELDAQLNDSEALAAYENNKALIESYKDKKLTRAEQNELKDAEAAVKAYDENVAKLSADIKAEKDNLEAWKENISTLEQNIAKCKADGEGIAALSTAINVNIMWFYGLMVFAIAFVIIAWILGMIQNPGSVWKTCIYMGVVAIVILGAYLVANANGWGFVNEAGEVQGKVLYDITGEPLGIGTGENREMFDAWHYMTADISILVTYIAFAGAALAAVFSWARGTFKS